MDLQNHESPNFENLGLPILEIWDSQLGSPGTKWHLGAGPVARHKKYYKKECGFPSSLNHGESCESMYVRGSFMHQKCSNHAWTNLLFGLCRFLWILDLLVTCPNPHPKGPHPKLPTHRFTPKVLWVRKHTSILSSSIVFHF
jgi:hypothetical protein